MSDFSLDYCLLLRTQVAEEIYFLTKIGHVDGINSSPCMFCLPHDHSKFACRRLKDLREFQSKIEEHRYMKEAIEKSKPVDEQESITPSSEEL